MRCRRIGNTQKIPFAHGILCALLVSLPLVRVAFAQSASQASAQPSQSSQTSNSSAGTTPASNSNAGKDNSTPGKVYNNDDMKALPPDDISVVGQPAPPHAPPKSPANSDAKAAAYWKARFTAARNKLAQDQKALPVLQSQLEKERVEQWSVNEETTQVYSDRFMYLLHRIDATKLAIQKDQRALNDLQDEFRHAGGLPGWIR